MGRLGWSKGTAIQILICTKQISGISTPHRKSICKHTKLFELRVHVRTCSQSDLSPYIHRTKMSHSESTMVFHFLFIYQLRRKLMYEFPRITSSSTFLPPLLGELSADGPTVMVAQIAFRNFTLNWGYQPNTCQARYC